MANLITLSEIQAVKPISSNLNASKKLNTFIEEAQDFDLRPIIGDEFYLALSADVLASPSLQTYGDLWNGSTYVYGSNTYKNYGLKIVLINYAYARYLKATNTNQTAFGAVQKVNPNSEPISEKALTRLVGQAISSAKEYEATVHKFLNLNNEDYPLYECFNDNGKRRSFRITGVRSN